MVIYIIHFCKTKRFCFMKKSYGKVNKCDFSCSAAAWLAWYLYFYQQICQAGAPLPPQDTFPPLVPPRRISLLLGYALGRILWPLFGAAAPNSASTQTSVSRCPEPWLERLLCFSLLYCFSKGWGPKKTVDSPCAFVHINVPRGGSFRKRGSRKENMPACCGASQLVLLYL